MEPADLLPNQEPERLGVEDGPTHAQRLKYVLGKSHCCFAVTSTDCDALTGRPPTLVVTLDDEHYPIFRIAHVVATRCLGRSEDMPMGIETFSTGRKSFLSSDRLQILNLVLSTHENAVERHRGLPVPTPRGRVGHGPELLPFPPAPASRSHDSSELPHR